MIAEYTEQVIDEEVARGPAGNVVARTRAQVEQTVRYELADGGFVEIAWTEARVCIRQVRDGVLEVCEGPLRLVERRRTTDINPA